MKISIATSVYDGAKALQTTLRSVARQRIDGFELEHVIVDGGAKNGSVDLIREYADGNEGGKWISEPDRGLYDGINKGIEYATGDIVV